MEIKKILTHQNVMTLAALVFVCMLVSGIISDPDTASIQEKALLILGVSIGFGLLIISQYIPDADRHMWQTKPFKALVFASIGLFVVFTFVFGLFHDVYQMFRLFF